MLFHQSCQNATTFQLATTSYLCKDKHSFMSTFSYSDQEKGQYSAALGYTAKTDEPIFPRVG